MLLLIEIAINKKYVNKNILVTNNFVKYFRFYLNIKSAIIMMKII